MSDKHRENNMDTPRIAYIVVYKNYPSSEFTNNAFVSIGSSINELLEHLVAKGAVIINIINTKDFY